jgi:putative toxin-antitoxin system antitoxin component (TIGR02293 family)
MPTAASERSDAPSGEVPFAFPELSSSDEPAVLAALVRRGLPADRFDALRDFLDVSAHELSEVVGITSSTLSRRRRSGDTLTKDESERLLRIGRIAARAADVLDGAGNARRWLTQPTKALGDEPPLRFADTEPGAREVERLLTRLEHGVYS